MFDGTLNKSGVDMRLVFNAFNPYLGKYQLPVYAVAKKRFPNETAWSILIEFPGKGRSYWMLQSTVEKHSMTKINTRKIKTDKYA
jgi:hypothetical protein